MMKRTRSDSSTVISILLAMMIVLTSVLQGAVITVRADPDDPGVPSSVTITAFSAVLEHGAEKTGDQYIWKAGSPDKGHAFIYRIDYSFSGENELPARAIKIDLPKHVLRNRYGEYSDEYELSVPNIAEAEAVTDFAFYEENDRLYITNNITMTAAQSGYFEIAYYTKELTYEYMDSDPDANDAPVFGCTISSGEIVLAHQTCQAPKAVIDTSAKIASTSKTYSYKRATEWNDNWGAKPADADEYYYLYWTIYTELSECSQPFDFTIIDMPESPDSEVVGYKMNGSSEITAEGHAVNQRPNKKLAGATSTIYYRYDYVITRHKRSAYPKTTYFTINNRIKAVVTPSDGIDEPTEAEAAETFINVPAEYYVPIGNYWSQKYRSGQYNFSLDDLRDGMITSTENNLDYSVYLYSQAYLWTLADGASSSDPYAFGKKKVKFEIVDDTLTFNGNSELLTSEDCELLSIGYDYYYRDARFDEDELRFNSVSPRFADDEAITIEAKFEDRNEFVTVGRYYLKSADAVIEDEYRSKVLSMDGSRIVFAEGAACTGFRLTTENVHLYTRIYAYPHYRLKASPYILSKLGDYNKVYLTNTATTRLYSGNEIKFDRTTFDHDVIVGMQRHSYIKKEAVSTQNNKLKKYVSNNWRAEIKETIETDTGVENLIQQSGRFYDLLPNGCEADEASVRVHNENGQLPRSTYEVSFSYNYKDSGRTLMMIDIKESGQYYELYYTTTYAWENFKDHGYVLSNSLAYETGNYNIASGYADNGGSIEDKVLMSDLDSDTDSKRFIYDQHKTVLQNIVTAATTGLSKKVIAKAKDTAYSYETNVGNNAPYSYKLRFATNMTSRARNVFLYDSLENYKYQDENGKWHGTLTGVDTSQPGAKGVAPKVYYSPVENLDLSEENNKNLCLSLSTDNEVNNAELSRINSDGVKIWYTEEEMISGFGGIAAAKAVCIDLSRAADGSSYVMDYDDSLSVILNFTSPVKDETNSDDPCALNNVLAFNTIIVEHGSEENAFIYHDYTRLHYRMKADVCIYKADSTDLSKPLKDIYFVLEGRSFYGTEVYIMLPTDGSGRLVFRDVEKGTYKLYETDGSIDYQSIKDDIKVVIDEQGTVTINGASSEDDISLSPESGRFTDGYYTIPNEPRVHTDIEFYKRSTAFKQNGVKGAVFRLYGLSDYGNQIMKNAESDADGRVCFENIEPGSYTLAETKSPAGYILDDTDYTVIVDDNAAFSITGITLNTDGTYVIYNEPYHSFTIQKTDYTTGASLGGASFTLTGTSDRGTVVNVTKTSNFTTGRLTFDGLEKGIYVLQESRQPNGYFPDDTKRIVTVSENGEVTVDGLQKNSSGNFVAENKKNGTITITKKWNDSAENDERPVPVVHLSNADDKVTTKATFKSHSGYVSSGGKTLSFFEMFFNNTHRNIKAFKPWTATEEVPAGVTTVRLDDQTTDSKILGWNDNGTFYWWSDAQEVFFNPDSSYFFKEESNLEEVDLTGISSSRIKDMSHMFEYCSKLKTLDLTHFDTSNAADMSYMFAHCGVTNLDLSGFNTSKVVDMSYMFQWNSSVKTLDVSSFDTSNVRNMSYMFYSCSGLTELDVSRFDTSKVNNMSNMFFQCYNIPYLDVSGFNTSNVTNMSGMFNYCSDVSEFALGGFDTSNVTNMSLMFRACHGITRIDLSNFDTSKVTNMQEMFTGCNGLLSIDLSPLDTSRVTNMNGMFSNCKSLTGIDVSPLDTSNVTDMGSMFSGCRGLTELDLKTFDTSNVKIMSSMFSDCTGLTALDLSGFETSFVTDMSSMFSNCSRLTRLDLGNFNTSNVTKMSSMFYSCTGLSTIDLSGFDTSKVTTMASMFSSCKGLRTIDLSSLDMSSVNYTTSMFSNCTGLNSIILTKNGTPNLNNVTSMFSGCSGLVSIDFGKLEFYAPSSMEKMFFGCSSLRKLDLSNFNTYFVTNTNSLFQGCSSLSTIYVRTFNIDKVTKSTNMFDGCTSLRGGKMTSYSASHKDKSYARIDDPDGGKPGYFTSLTDEDKDPEGAYISDAMRTFINKNSSAEVFVHYTGTDESVQQLIADGITRVDDETTGKKVYMWYDADNKTVYWWSDAQTVYLPENCTKLFMSASTYVTIDMRGLDGSRVAAMDYMFYWCTNLTTLYLDGLDTSKVTNMYRMFYYCYNLTELDVSSFDTSNVTNMGYMFYECRNLTELDLSSFNTSQVTDMRGMFSGCYGLTGLDLSAFDTSNVTNMNSLFSGCKGLTELDLNAFDTKKVTDMSALFSGCSGLTEIDLSQLDAGNTKKMRNMFNGCTGLTDIDLSKLDSKDVTDMGYMFSNCTGLTTIDLSKLDSKNVTDMSYMFSGCTGLTNIDLSKLDTSSAKTLNNLLYNCSGLTEFDFSGLDLSGVRSINSMLRGCTGLTEIDMSGFDLSDVTDINYLFYGCSNLLRVDMSGIKAATINSMSNLFYNCSALTQIDLRNGDFSGAVSLYGLFSGCSALTDIYLDEIDISGVENMNYLFSGCSSLTSIDLSSLDTSRVKSMSYMFNNCSGLTRLDLNGFDTSNVTDFSYMFRGCTSLRNLDLSGFDTAGAANMNYMFNGCGGLRILDLSSFNTGMLKTFNYLFKDCTGLTTIYASSLWSTEHIVYLGSNSNVFGSNNNLVGGKGTRYRYSDASYARLDDPDNGKPGYFTSKVPGGEVYSAIIHYVSDPAETSGVRMADGSSVGTARCIIYKNAGKNTWTYTFTGINDTVKYTVWEDTVPGYTGNVTAAAPGTVTEGGFTIINTAPDAPKYGSLKINKVLSAAAGTELLPSDKNTGFVFVITLTDENGAAVTGTRLFGDVAFRDGRGIITVKPDDAGADNGKTITDIPEGWHYTVTEQASDGFTLSVHSNDTGVITADTTVSAVFTNEKDAVQEKPTATVKLKKSVTGNYEFLDENFEFTASFTGLAAGKTYYFLRDGGAETTFTADRAGIAELKLTLSADETVEFPELPADSFYRFTEKGGDYFIIYAVNDENGLGLINSTSGRSAEKNKALSTANETVDAGEAVTVTFTNRINKTQDLILRKLVTSSSENNNDPFDFVVYFSGLEPDTRIASSVGTLTADSAGAIEVQFVLKNGQTAVFYDLPVRSKYRIVELASAYAASYTVTDVEELGKIVSDSGSNGSVVNKSLSTAAETVDQGEDITVTFTNRKLDHDVSITKRLDLTGADDSDVSLKTKKFCFRINFRNLTADKIYKISYTSENTTGSIDTSFTPDSENASLELELSEGYTATVRGLEEGVCYTVTELYDSSDRILRSFVASYRITANSGAVIAGPEAANKFAGALSTHEEVVDAEDLDVNIVFTNKYEFASYILPMSGFTDNRAMLILSFAGAVLFAALYFVSRRRMR